MLQLGPDGTVAERQESVKRLRWVGVGHTFDELMDGADGVRPDVLGGIIEHQAQNHVVQRLG